MDALAGLSFIEKMPQISDETGKKLIECYESIKKLPITAAIVDCWHMQFQLFVKLLTPKNRMFSQPELKQSRGV